MIFGLQEKDNKGYMVTLGVVLRCLKRQLRLKTSTARRIM
jgi:hypothetical protein